LTSDADQIEARVDDGPGSVGKSNERQDGSRSPDFRVVGARSFELGKGEDDVSDRAWTD
jgi:hypothetical protein